MASVSGLRPTLWQHAPICCCTWSRLGLGLGSGSESGLGSAWGLGLGPGLELDCPSCQRPGGRHEDHCARGEPLQEVVHHDGGDQRLAWGAPHGTRYARHARGSRPVRTVRRLRGVRVSTASCPSPSAARRACSRRARRGSYSAGTRGSCAAPSEGTATSSPRRTPVETCCCSQSSTWPSSLAPPAKHLADGQASAACCDSVETRSARRERGISLKSRGGKDKAHSEARLAEIADKGPN
eukprot:scaffold109698_cov60-Phaeocystis_antarctica.AAC.5